MILGSEKWRYTVGKEKKIYLGYMNQFKSQITAVCLPEDTY